MESLMAIALIVGVCYWFYRSGKRIGSVKGFNVGHRRRRYRRR
jgi:hypothetical protein